jgi:hypothetical protein
LKKLILIQIILSTFFWTCSALAQDNWETYGYAKYLFSSTENGLLSKNTLTDHQIHLRLNNRWYATENLTAGLELRLRGFYGGLVKNQFLTEQTVVTNYPYTNLGAVFWDKKSTLAYGQIDRLFLDYNFGDWQFTLGRQRIAWGTSFVWNITDLFNPQSILDFDYEEKPGSDALRIQYFTSVDGRLELVIKPSPDRYERSAALLWLVNNWDYDFYVIGAWQYNRPVLAAAFAGDIRGAGFRGEFKMSDKISRSQLGGTFIPFINTNYSDSNAKSISAVISIDYTFASSLYLNSEILYNSIGKTKNTGIYAPQAIKAGLLSPAHISLFFETAYDLHPLLRGDIFVLFNPDDESVIAAPSLSWSVITNLDLYLIGFIADGDVTSEFGSFGKALFFRTKFSF